MLVNRQQEWVQYPPQEKVKKTVPLASARPDNSFRRKCLQLIMLVAVAAMLVTIQSEIMVRSGYDLVDLKSQTAKLEKENELLRLDIARLKSPERIQQIATRELGMVMPKNTYYASNSGKTAVNQAGEVASGQPSKGIMLINKVEASKAH
ncbi:MAG: cell division protein FtsL [Negativicutes bacterium]|nr:cell division protein FtsL [Negativicutes bacterium]